jgi:hypothetical protein
LLFSRICITNGQKVMAANESIEHQRGNMIEKVALEISIASGERQVSDHHRVLARAAIRAMRQPTNDVHEAMCKAFNSPAAIWDAGINAALAHSDAYGKEPELMLYVLVHHTLQGVDLVVGIYRTEEAAKLGMARTKV